MFCEQLPTLQETPLPAPEQVMLEHKIEATDQSPQHRHFVVTIPGEGGL